MFLKHRIKHMLDEIRKFIQRGKWGYSASDVWEFSDWFLDVIPKMLRYLKDNGIGYPAEYEDREEWEQILDHLASELEFCTDKSRETNNEFHKEYINTLYKANILSDNPERDEIFDKYWDRSEEIYKEQCVRLKAALCKMADIFYGLWD